MVSFCRFKIRCFFFDHRSTHRNIRDLRTVFPNDRTDGVSSRNSTVTNKSKPLTYTVASSFVCTSPLAVITAVGVLDTRTISSSAEFGSFLLSMCIDAPESKTNSLFSCSILDGERRHRTSEGEKNNALFWSRASLWSSRLFLRLAIKLWSMQTALMRMDRSNISPGTHNPIVLHSLLGLQKPFNHPFSVACSADDQPPCARLSTFHQKLQPN